jgi:hypothetical protein
MTDDGPRPFSPACERNRHVILAVLERWLPEQATVLEIGSGSGQHARHFTSRQPGWRWQPSEHPSSLATLRLGLAGTGLSEPLALDVSDAAGWPQGPTPAEPTAGTKRFDAVFSANTCHIMDWGTVQQMIRRSAAHLETGGLLLLYGPFHRLGRPTSESNAAFDRMLQQRDPEMGVRDDQAIISCAAAAGLTQAGDEAMPANNRMLIFRFVTVKRPAAGD